MINQHAMELRNAVKGHAYVEMFVKHDIEVAKVKESDVLAIKHAPCEVVIVTKIVKAMKLKLRFMLKLRRQV